MRAPRFFPENQNQCIELCHYTGIRGFSEQGLTYVHTCIRASSQKKKPPDYKEASLQEVGDCEAVTFLYHNNDFSPHVYPI